MVGADADDRCASVPVPELLDGVQALVEAHMLRLDQPADAADDPRLALLETLRAYALERLEASGEAATIRGRHAVFYLALTGSEQAAWLARLEREHDNLRAALQWARGSANVAYGLRLVGALAPFWQRHSHLSEGRRWLDQFLEDAGAHAVSPEVRATALAGAIWLAQEQDDFARADALAAQGLALYRTLGQTGRIADVLGHRGVIARACELAGEALALFHAHGIQSGIAEVLVSLGMLEIERRDVERARALLAEALARGWPDGSHTPLVAGLEDMARVAVIQERAAIAARLCGAAAAWRAAMGAPLPPYRRAAHERALTAARGALGEGAFAAAWSAGEALRPEQAVAEALILGGEDSGLAAHTAAGRPEVPARRR